MKVREVKFLMLIVIVIDLGPRFRMKLNEHRTIILLYNEVEQQQQATDFEENSLFRHPLKGI